MDNRIITELHEALNDEDRIHFFAPILKALSSELGRNRSIYKKNNESNGKQQEIKDIENAVEEAIKLIHNDEPIVEFKNFIYNNILALAPELYMDDDAASVSSTCRSPMTFTSEKLFSSEQSLPNTSIFSIIEIPNTIECIIPPRPELSPKPIKSENAEEGIKYRFVPKRRNKHTNPHCEWLEWKEKYNRWNEIRYTLLNEWNYECLRISKENKSVDLIEREKELIKEKGDVTAQIIKCIEEHRKHIRETEDVQTTLLIAQMCELIHNLLSECNKNCESDHFNGKIYAYTKKCESYIII